MTDRLVKDVSVSAVVSVLPRTRSKPGQVQLKFRCPFAEVVINIRACIYIICVVSSENAKWFYFFIDKIHGILKVRSVSVEPGFNVSLKNVLTKLCPQPPDLSFGQPLHPDRH